MLSESITRAALVLAGVLAQLNKETGSGSSTQLALLFLSEGPSRRIDLARKIGISTAAATGLIDVLMRKELVEEKRSEADRRAWFVTLTDKGRRAVGDAVSPILSMKNLPTPDNAHQLASY